ncbi:MAG: transcriptional repressor AgaR [Pseudomonadota bacterium]
MRNTRQRREAILQRLTRHGGVKVAHLMNDFGVSAVTIRSDLRTLEARGMATRSHGGAILARAAGPEQSVLQKDAINHLQKERIGALAATLVRQGDNIIIDAGSTTICLARQLRLAQRVTVLTNALNVAWELAGAPGVELILAGGVLRKQSLSIQGGQAETTLQAYNFDKLFLGVDGFDLQFGITTHHEAEARLNNKMVERAKCVVVLADSSKFGRVSLHRIAQLDRIHTVVTDSGIGQRERDALARLGINLLIAE